MKAGARRTRVGAVAVAPPNLGSTEGDTKVNRAVDQLTDAVNQLGAADFFVDDVDLAVGTTTIAHGLNRRPAMVQVAPLVAAAGFAWGWNPDQPGNPKPDLLVQLTSATAATVRIKVE